MENLLIPLKNYLFDQRQAMEAALRDLVEIQSGTYHKAGVDRMCGAIHRMLTPLPLTQRILPQPSYGDMLIASAQPETDRGHILLTGHLDTVFPEDSPFTEYREDDHHLYGPGVIDMKGGLVCGIFALKALDVLGMLRGLPVTFLFNSDEEIGSPASRSLFAAEAGRSAMAFVLECGGLQGEIATGRKGRLGIQIFAGGTAGHAAKVVKSKKSAILDLAQIIVALEALNGTLPGLSVNVGQIGGGTRPNIVPDEAWAAVDIRYGSLQEYADFRARLDALLRCRTETGMTLRHAIISETPVMEATVGNKALFAVAAREARRLGISAIEEFRSGASDANFIAAAGTPVLDGLGPIGDHDHSDREYLIRESLVTRTALLALTLSSAWRRHQEGTLFPTA